MSPLIPGVNYSSHMGLSESGASIHHKCCFFLRVIYYV